MSGNLQKLEEALSTLEGIGTSKAWKGGLGGGFKETLDICLNDCYFHNYNHKNKGALDPIRNIPEGEAHTFFKAWNDEDIGERFNQGVATDQELDSISLTPLYRAIPKAYIDNGSYYFFLEGNFYKVVLSNPSLPNGRNYFTIANMGKEEPKVDRIVDITRLKPSKLREAGGAVSSVISAYRDYVYDMSYDPRRYIVEKEVVKEVSEKYDPEFSLTKEETAKMYEWQRKHSKKYHKNGACSGGASPVSFYEISYGCCSIGSWWDCTCADCKAKGKPKEVYQYEIRSDL